MHGMTPDGRVLHNGKPIVAIDIDGTLADYHGWFLRFAEGYLGRAMPLMDTNPGLPLHEFMGLTKEEYRQVKLAYRQGGLKRSMPVFEGASYLTQSIEDAGAEVWICTTRPYLRLDNIDPDTREWLERHNIQYTALLFGDSKYEDLVESVGADRIVAVVEDLPEMVDRAKAQGLTVYTPERPYNGSVDFRFHNLDEICECVLNDIDKWKANRVAVPEEYQPWIERQINKEPASGDASIFKDMPYPWFKRTLALSEADHEYERDRERRWLNLADEALELFIRKSRDYGKTGDSLGARGQFADMWRKFGKIKHQVWDNPEKVVHFEGVEEILKDLIGHSILFLDYVKGGNKQ